MDYFLALTGMVWGSISVLEGGRMLQVNCLHLPPLDTPSHVSRCFVFRKQMDKLERPEEGFVPLDTVLHARRPYAYWSGRIISCGLLMR